MQGELTGPVTVRESTTHEQLLPLGQTSRIDAASPNIRRPRSFTYGMDIQTPLRCPTEHYAAVTRKSTTHSCRSCTTRSILHECRTCSSFDEAAEGGTRFRSKDFSEEDESSSDSYDRIPERKQDSGRFKRQDSQYSCDVSELERRPTEYSCYVPTRRNTVAGRNGPIQYYVPSRGPGKDDTWFPQLRPALQERDQKTMYQPGTTTYLEPAMVNFLGLTMMDVKLHSPVVVPRSLPEQQASQKTEPGLADQETHRSSSPAPEQTGLRLVRNETEFSCAPPHGLEKQSPGQVKRKETRFSCAPTWFSEAPLSESQFSESQFSESQFSESQFSESQFSESQFSDHLSDTGVASEKQSSQGQVRFSCAPTRFSEAQFSDTQSSDHVPDTVDDQKSSRLSEVPSAINTPANDLKSPHLPDLRSVVADQSSVSDLPSVIVTPAKQSAEVLSVSGTQTGYQKFSQSGSVAEMSRPKISSASFQPPGQEPAGVPATVGIVQPPKVIIEVPADLAPNLVLPVKSFLKADDVQSTSMKQSSIAALHEIPEVQPDSHSSAISPKTTIVGLARAADRVIHATVMPTRISAKRDSTVRSNSQRNLLPPRLSKAVRNMSSDSALKETAKTPVLLCISRKAAATRQVVLKADMPPSEKSNEGLQDSESLATAGTGNLRPPSLRSGSSRKKSGAVRHALLSTAITAPNQIDMGSLPIAPVLSVDLAAASGVGSGLDSLAVTLRHTESQSPTGMPNVASLPMYATVKLQDDPSPRVAVAAAQPNVMAVKHFEQQAREGVDTRSSVPVRLRVASTLQYETERLSKGNDSTASLASSKDPSDVNRTVDNPSPSGILEDHASAVDEHVTVAENSSTVVAQVPSGPAPERSSASTRSSQDNLSMDNVEANQQVMSNLNLSEPTPLEPSGNSVVEVLLMAGKQSQVASKKQNSQPHESTLTVDVAHPRAIGQLRTKANLTVLSNVGSSPNHQDSAQMSQTPPVIIGTPSDQISAQSKEVPPVVRGPLSVQDSARLSKVSPIIRGPLSHHISPEVPLIIRGPLSEDAARLSEEEEEGEEEEEEEVPPIVCFGALGGQDPVQISEVPLIIRGPLSDQHSRTPSDHFDHQQVLARNISQILPSDMPVPASTGITPAAARNASEDVPLPATTTQNTPTATRSVSISLKELGPDLSGATVHDKITPANVPSPSSAANTAVGSRVASLLSQNEPDALLPAGLPELSSAIDQPGDFLATVDIHGEILSTSLVESKPADAPLPAARNHTPTATRAVSLGRDEPAMDSGRAMDTLLVPQNVQARPADVAVPAAKDDDTPAATRAVSLGGNESMNEAGGTILALRNVEFKPAAVPLSDTSGTTSTITSPSGRDGYTNRSKTEVDALFDAQNPPPQSPSSPVLQNLHPSQWAEAVIQDRFDHRQLILLPKAEDVALPTTTENTPVATRTVSLDKTDATNAAPFRPLIAGHSISADVLRDQAILPEVCLQQVAETRNVTTDPHLEYWGFVPPVEVEAQDIIQGAVQEAFQDAVRKVVHYDAGITVNFSASETSMVYRQLIADSLDEAAKTADVDLRLRSSQERRVSQQVLTTSQTLEQDFEEIRLDPREDLKRPENIVTQNDTSKFILQEGKAVDVLTEREATSPVTGARNARDPRSYTPSQYSANKSRQESDSTICVGSHEVAFESYERLASVPHQPESPDEPTAEKESALRMAWNALSGARKISYSAVPTQTSATEQEPPTRKQSSRVSPARISQATTAALRSLSLSSFQEKAREARESFELVENEKHAAVETDTDNRSIKAKPAPTATRRRTVRWLRELLLNDQPYATRLTTLPPRTARDCDRRVLQRSETAPATQPVEEVFLGATPRPTVHLEGMETYSRTVFDVEQLLSEALLLATQAVENDRAADVIPVLENAAAVLRSGRPEIQRVAIGVPQPTQERTEGISDSYGEILESGSMHESDRSTYSEDRFSDGDAYDATEREMLLPDRTTHLVGELDEDSHVLVVEPLPDRKKSWAGWPPTGRAATPFPPRSAVDSTLSTERGEPDFPPVVEAQEILREQPPIPIRQGSVRGARISLPQTTHLVEVVDGSTIEPEAAIEQNNLEDAVIDPVMNYWSRPVPTANLAKEEDERRKIPLPKPPRAPSGPEGRPKALPDKREVRDFIKVYRQPPISPRHSSLKLRAMLQAAGRANPKPSIAHTIPARTKPNRTTDMLMKCGDIKGKAVAQDSRPDKVPLHQNSPAASLDGPPPEEEIDLGIRQPTIIENVIPRGIRKRTAAFQSRQVEGSNQAARGQGHEGIPEDKAVESYELREMPLGANLPTTRRAARNRELEDLNLRGRSHVSLKEHHRFSLGRSKKRQPIARDWSPAYKKFTAAVSCISTALIGILIGIYAGEVPSIQYYLADMHHYSILGNVFLFLGLSIPTFFFWPLPLLHGRKPYILASLSIAMPLLFPQAVVISSPRSPYEAYWRIGLLLPRAVLGFVLGFANMNFQATLLDLFGASLQSGNPHQEVIDEFDVRRHGGGMGAWLGLWTWCYIGSIGVGFAVGAIIINYLAPSWGMYIGILILVFISVIQVVTPEVRRGAYRRSVAEVKTDQGISRRVARGEVMMHRVQTGPKWFGQELYHGMLLSRDMLKQPGFLVMAIYQAWIYGQVVLLIALLGSLMSNSYRFQSPLVGASVAAIPAGAILAIPFERASFFSRSRVQGARTNSNTFDNKITWKSHVLRRAIFTLSLPITGAGYTATSSGPPIPWIFPILFAAAFGFLSNMTIAECVGIIMETWDTSDLQPGMTGRSRRGSGEDSSNKRTNYSSFPRVASAFAITQGIGFVIAALATAVGGVATRNLGQQAATGVMAGILFVLTLLFFAVLVRWQVVQIIPTAKTGEMDLYLAQRRLSALRPPGAPEAEEPWRPVIIGNPRSKTREMCIIELGSLTRWSEIRRKNRLYDESVAHPDREVLHQAYLRLEEKQYNAVRSVQGSLKSAHGSLRGKMSRGNSYEGGSRRRAKERRQDTGSSDKE